MCILLAAGYGKDVFFEVVISLCCSASMILCILIFSHVSYCEFNDLWSASFASRGFIARFTNQVLVVTGSLHGGLITLSSSMILLLHSVSYPQLNSWYLLLLSPEFFWGLLMVKGHKVYPLWPKASPLNDPYGSIKPKCPYCQLASLWG